jgi:hypothetical protein
VRWADEHHRENAKKKQKLQREEGKGKGNDEAATLKLELTAHGKPFSTIRKAEEDAAVVGQGRELASGGKHHRITLDIEER